MLKIIARKLLRAIPQNKGLFIVMKIVGVPDKVSHYLNFKDARYKVSVGKKTVFFFSNGLIQDNRLFWRGIQSGENFTMQLWQFLCQSNKVIMDVGANIGVFAIVAKSISPNAEVHGFEPVPATYKMFKKNIEVNSFDITSHELALSNTSGSAEIFMDGENNLIPSMNKKGTGTTIKVQMRTLDSLIQEKGIGKIDLLKIDVETFEPEVLKGMENIIKNNSPTLIIEILNNEVGARNQEILDGKGYLYFYIDEQDGLISSEKLIRYNKSRNYLVCQKNVANEVLKQFSVR
jgi:FkbM family methyltransferase